MRHLPVSALRSGAFAIAICVSLAGTSRAGVLHSQAADFPGSFDAFTSQTGTDFQTFDNVTLSETSFVQSVSWQGLYWDFQNSAANPIDPGSFGFDIQFYSDNAGSPDSLLASYSFADVAHSIAGTATFTDGQTTRSDVNVYDFSVDLPTAFLAQAGKTVWMSIVGQPNTPSSLSWLWNSGSGGDGQSVQFESGAAPLALSDRAFELQGVIAPEPSTWAMLSMGMVSLLCYGMRRKAA